MKVAYCSDLHLSNHRMFGEYIYPDLSSDADVLIIAGDMVEYDNGNIHDKFIIELSKQYQHILIVEGNHEFYKKDILITPPIYPSNVHVLRNECIKIEDTTFYGGTLWCDIGDMNDLDSMVLYHMIGDFRLISYDNSLITTKKLGALYNEFLDGLMEASLYNDKLFVISHFAPSNKSISPMYKNNTVTNRYFCNDMDEIIKGMNISHFVHGHTHNSFDYMIGNINVLCNPRGYPHENNDNDYTVKVIEV